MSKPGHQTMAGLFEVNSIKGSKKEVIELPYISEVRIRLAEHSQADSTSPQPLLPRKRTIPNVLEPSLLITTVYCRSNILASNPTF
jgi:hypothetical protein